MEAPSSTIPEAIRDEQAKVLRTIRPMSADHLVTGQVKGYKDEPGVNPDSKTSTYAALRMYVDSWRWEGVPFYVRAGKSLATTCTEVCVELKNPPQVVFKEPAPPMGNTLRFRFNPTVAISLGARKKTHGEKMVGESVNLLAVEEPAQGSEGRMDAYERLLGDAMLGDTTLFARQDLVEAAWAIVDPVLHGSGGLYEYEPGSWGPKEADALTAEVGGWNPPHWQ
jgi:glucose-6-phosphate 1-dehydrogenase